VFKFKFIKTIKHTLITKIFHDLRPENIGYCVVMIQNTTAKNSFKAQFGVDNSAQVGVIGAHNWAMSGWTGTILNDATNTIIKTLTPNAITPLRATYEERKLRECPELICFYESAPHPLDAHYTVNLNEMLFRLFVIAPKITEVTKQKKVIGVDGTNCLVIGSSSGAKNLTTQRGTNYQIVKSLKELDAKKDSQYEKYIQELISINQTGHIMVSMHGDVLHLYQTTTK
jgi:hypothetical protein